MTKTELELISYSAKLQEEIDALKEQNALLQKITYCCNCGGAVQPYNPPNMEKMVANLVDNRAFGVVALKRAKEIFGNFKE